MTDDLDDAIRSRLQRSGHPSTEHAHHVLNELRPAMRRARVKRSLAVGTATLSVLGVVGVGVVAVTDSITQDPRELDILVDGDPLPDVTPPPPTTDAERNDNDDGDGTGDVVTTRTLDSSTTAPTTTASTTTAPTTTAPSTTVANTTPGTTAPTESGAGTTPATTVADETTTSAPRGTNPPTTTAPATTAAPATAPPTTAPPTTTSAPPTTAPPTTAPPTSGQQSVQSNCGSITVSWIGEDISLDSTQPAPGFSPEIREAGPEEVEVRFDDGDAECEIEAWIESGTLRTDVENDDD